MLWLEMSRDPIHGAGNWGFTQCLWSPSHKQNDTKWAFWETILQTQAGDAVLHLRGKSEKAAFVGFSVIDADGFETFERPPEPGQWAYARSYYRALLRDFTFFTDPLPLSTVFQQQDMLLRNYFYSNQNKPKYLKKRVFYVVQAGRLQCLNGAYLSEVDNELAGIILSSPYYRTQPNIPQRVIREEVGTGEQLRQLRSRLGQSDFSDQVRSNYDHQCCFPGCTIAESRFLVGAHIARWADVPELRGSLSNGLCFCLMHDKAFEAGLFTLSLGFEVWVNKAKISSSKWGTENLLPYHGKRIKTGNILPSGEALLRHWERTNLYPEF